MSTAKSTSVMGQEGFRVWTISPVTCLPRTNIDYGMNPGAVVNSCYQDVGSQPLPVLNGQGK